MLRSSADPAPLVHHRSAPGACATLSPTESKPVTWATSTSSVGERSAAADSWMASLFIGPVCPARPERTREARQSARQLCRLTGLRHNARVYLAITSTGSPATDLGFLLHKHP